MPVVGIKDLGRNLSELIGRVEAGETLLITRHGKPTAAMLPISGDRLEALTLAAAPRLIKDATEALDELHSGSGATLDELLAEAEAAERNEARQPATTA